jgi:hypothetical protein
MALGGTDSQWHQVLQREHGTLVPDGLALSASHSGNPALGASSALSAEEVLRPPVPRPSLPAAARSSAAARPPEAPELRVVPSVASSPVVARYLASARPTCLQEGQANLHAEDANRGDLPRREEPSLGHELALRSMPQRQASGSVATDRCARHAPAMALRRNGSTIGSRMSFSGQHRAPTARVAEAEADQFRGHRRR